MADSDFGTVGVVAGRVVQQDPAVGMALEARRKEAGLGDPIPVEGPQIRTVAYQSHLAQEGTIQAGLEGTHPGVQNRYGRAVEGDRREGSRQEGIGPVEEGNSGSAAVDVDQAWQHLVAGTAGPVSYNVPCQRSSSTVTRNDGVWGTQKEGNGNIHTVLRSRWFKKIYIRNV